MEEVNQYQKIKHSLKKYYQTEQGKKKHREAYLKYVENNRELVNERSKAYYHKNKEMLTCKCGKTVFKKNYKYHAISQAHLRKTTPP